MRGPEVIPDAEWVFWDSWKAFPFTRLNDLQRDQSRVGQLWVSLRAEGGGTLGEFGISFIRLGGLVDGEVAARLEAFDDAWRVLASSGLIDVLGGAVPHQRSMAGIASVLVGLGFRDVTDELRGRQPSTCPTCRGTGRLDEIGVTS
jgi:hypothetical protein